LYQVTLTKEQMIKIQNEVNEKMINLYYKSTWKPKVGDPVSEIFYPENGVGKIIDLFFDDLSTTALVEWQSCKKEYIETRHLSLVLDE